MWLNQHLIDISSMDQQPPFITAFLKSQQALEYRAAHTVKGHQIETILRDLNTTIKTIDTLYHPHAGCIITNLNHKRHSILNYYILHLDPKKWSFCRQYDTRYHTYTLSIDEPELLYNKTVTDETHFLRLLTYLKQIADDLQHDQAFMFFKPQTQGAPS